MATVDTVDTNCNTKINLRTRCWSFTVFEYDESIKNKLIDYIRHECKDGGFQEECCPTTQKTHLQGFIYFDNARSFDRIKAELGVICNKPPHIEKARNYRKLKEYCRKNETKVEGGTRYELKPKLPDPLEGKELYPYQKEILEIVSVKPDDRTIHWYWEPTGNIGKTTLCRHIVRKYDKETLYLDGKATDILYGVKEFLDNGEVLRIALFDFTRSIEGFVSYTGLERLKNGLFFNTKYKSGMVDIAPPHVICFANFAPDTTKLSNDRWRLVRITAPCTSTSSAT